MDPELVRTGDFHYESALTAASALLRLPDRPTAIFAASDVQAMGVYEAARRYGLRLPQDLSVVGFDDVPMAQWVSPPLTTLRQPLAEMATLAARTLLVGDSMGLQNRVELATTLVVRSSTQPPAGGPDGAGDACGRLRKPRARLTGRRGSLRPVSRRVRPRRAPRRPAR